MGGSDTFDSRLDMMVRCMRVVVVETNNVVQFKPNMAIQDLGDNGAGITTLMNIGYVELCLFSYIH